MPLACLLDSRPEQKSLVTFYTLPSLYVCAWLVNTLISAVHVRTGVCAYIDGTHLLLLFKRCKVSTVEIHLDSVDNRPGKKAMLWKNEVRLHSKMTKVTGSKL